MGTEITAREEHRALRRAIDAPMKEPTVAGEYRRVPIRELRLDSTYQRDLDITKIRKMVEDWDPRRAQAIVVSHRAKILWIVDGQHRVAALRERGELFTEAVVHEGMTKQDEADLFVALQRGRKNLNAWDLFKAELAAGHTDVLSLVTIVSNEGFFINRTAGYNHIGAVGALRRIHRMGGEDLLSPVLSMTRVCWAGDKRALDGQTLEGLAIFLHSFRGEPQYQDERTRAILENTPAVTILRLAQEIAATRAAVTSSATNVAEAIRNRYNERLHGAKRLGAVRRGTKKGGAIR